MVTGGVFRLELVEVEVEGSSLAGVLFWCIFWMLPLLVTAVAFCRVCFICSFHTHLILYLQDFHTLTANLCEPLWKTSVKSVL